MTKDVVSLIELLPDELPCHLAGLCRLSCRDVSPVSRGSPRSNLLKVFAYRSKIFSSVLVSGPIYHDVHSRDPGPPPKSWFSAFFLEFFCHPRPSFSQGIVEQTIRGWNSQRIICSPFVFAMLTFPSGKVCNHEGPCHNPTRGECHCYIRKVHCSRNCPCAQSCESSFPLSHSSPLSVTSSRFSSMVRLFAWKGPVLIARRKGCKCVWKRTGPKKIPCSDAKGSKCECRAAYRECDPEVCGGCHARYALFMDLPEYFDKDGSSVTP